MKTLDDALAIRRRVFGAFEMAETATDPAERRRWLTFALVGGGPTGVELAGQIRELATHTLRDEFRRSSTRRTRGCCCSTAAQRAARILRTQAVSQGSDGAAKTGRRAAHELAGHRRRQGGLVVRDQDGATTRYEVGTVLWTAGVEAPPLAGRAGEATGAKQDRAGRIVVHRTSPSPATPRSRWSAI